jgi:hypothetical protein
MRALLLTHIFGSRLVRSLKCHEPVSSNTNKLVTSPELGSSDPSSYSQRLPREANQTGKVSSDPGTQLCDSDAETGIMCYLSPPFLAWLPQQAASFSNRGSSVSPVLGVILMTWMACSSRWSFFFVVVVPIGRHRRDCTSHRTSVAIFFSFLLLLSFPLCARTTNRSGELFIVEKKNLYIPLCFFFFSVCYLSSLIS